MCVCVCTLYYEIIRPPSLLPHSHTSYTPQQLHVRPFNPPPPLPAPVYSTRAPRAGSQVRRTNRYAYSSSTRTRCRFVIIIIIIICFCKILRVNNIIIIIIQSRSEQSDFTRNNNNNSRTHALYTPISTELHCSELVEQDDILLNAVRNILVDTRYAFS